MGKDKLRLIFMGTPGFALPMLEVAIQEENAVAVVTQPDRPVGRKRQLTPPPVKVLALEKGVEVYQPENVSHPDAVKKIGELKPDLILVVAYGSILKRQLLEIPRMGCINIHPSLLPRYRGPCPIEWTLIKGEKLTGVTCIYMDEGMDSGNIITQRKLDVLISDTTGTLREKLSRLGGEVLAETLTEMENGKVESYAQEGEPTHAPMLSKKDCHIDWSKPALDIHNLVRALNPHLGARTCAGGQATGKGLIIWETALSDAECGDSEPGKVIGVSEDGLLVLTGKGCLLVKSVQPAGGRKQTAAEYMRGHKVDKFL